MRTLILIASFALASASAGAQTQPQAAKPAAQTPAPQPAQTTPAAQPAAPQTAAPAGAAPTAEAPPQAEAYTYRAEGRRDPFQTLIGAGTGVVAASRRGEGASGLAVGEISVRGIMQSRGSLVAMVMGPDNRTYIVHQGDKLLDGTIKTITPQGLIVVQEVNDPLSLVKQREVRKLLRSLEDAK
jgi:Tfp pilus assembly protein PilP